jgi:hypothetical protein
VNGGIGRLVMCYARSSSFQKPQCPRWGLCVIYPPKKRHSALCHVERHLRILAAHQPIICHTCFTCCRLRERTHVSTSLDQIASYNTIFSMSEGFGALQGELCAILCSWNPYQQYAGCPSCWYVPQVRRLIATRFAEYALVIAVAVAISYVLSRRMTDNCVRKEKES